MMPSVRRVYSILMLLVLLTACSGQTAPPAPTAAPTIAPAAEPTSASAAPTGAPTSAPATSTDFPRTITHSKGELTLEQPALRVAALEWTYVEDLLALGIQPVAVADIEGYNTWVKTPIALGPEAQDVGGRGEPNLEKLASLNLDLIIDVEDNVATNYDELVKIAPVLVFTPYSTDPTMDQYAEMSETLLKIAAATGRDAEGQAALERMNATFDELAAKIEAAGHKGAPFILSQAWSSSGAVSIRLFTETAMASQIVERLGLVPGWKDPTGFQPYGFSVVTVEALPEISADTRFFYVVQNSDNVFEMSSVKPLWDNLSFVKAGNAHALGGDTWLFGGPLSAEVLAGIVANALTADATAPAEPAAAGQPVTITHLGGEMTFESVPQRVVVLEYSYADALFALDLQPTGYADDGVPAYLLKRLEQTEATPVGTRAEPNLELIAALKPDLVIADKTRHEKIYETLNQIAPTVLFDSYRGSFENQLEIFKTLGTLFQKEQQAQTLIENAQQELEDAKQLAKGHERPVAVGVLASTGLTAHSSASYMGSLLGELGLQTELGPKDGETQFLLTMESVAELNPQAFVITCSPDDQQLLDDWTSQEVWQQLDAAKQQQVYVFNRDLWSRSRGILALSLVLRDVRESGLLTGEPSRSTSCPAAVVE